jgi:hypothetical protein
MLTGRFESLLLRHSQAILGLQFKFRLGALAGPAAARRQRGRGPGHRDRAMTGGSVPGPWAAAGAAAR